MESAEMLIVGTGAMACMFAARFLAAGIHCSMLGSWSEGVAALAQNGVRIFLEDGTEQVFPVRVATDPRTYASVQNVMVLVKSYQTERAANQLVDCLDEEGIALSLQNGLGNYEILAQKLGPARVALGSTTAGAHLLAPGVVKLAGTGVVTLGVHARMKPFHDMLGRAGFVVESEADLNSILWGKLVINCAINPLTALLRVANGELLLRPTARSLMAAAAREAAAVAVSKGVTLPYPDPVVAVETIAKRTAYNYSSMLQDVRRGAPTEVESVCGVLVKEGEIMDVPTPVNRVLLYLILALNKQAG
jgi:2-dehydropantoate 2-reductase